jgi:hypothetical protein
VIYTGKEKLKVMFYDRKVWEFISKNKPTANQSICLSMNLLLGYLKNGETWYTVAEYNQMFGTQTAPELGVSIQVSVDQDIVYSGNSTQPIYIDHQFQDSEQHQNRQIKIVLQGMGHHHNVKWPGTGEPLGLALRVSGHLENLPLTLIMSKFAKYFVEDDQSINVATKILGQNGYQLLDFQTPFYAWLHQHREALIWELTHPNGYQE